MKVVAVIPARYGSKRFEGKALYPYQDKPLLFYVWKSLKNAKTIDQVIIATDDSRIEIAAQNFGAEVLKTSNKHKTGTDRMGEVAQILKSDIYINVQADNFGLKSAVLDRVIDKFKKDRDIYCATLIKPITDDNNLFDPNHVKVIIDKNDNALWFSRYPLPFIQNATDNPRTKQFKFWGHIGIYLFKKNALLNFYKQKQSPLEIAESLEQLRILENGGSIKTYQTNMKTVSVDTRHDLDKIGNL